MGKTLTWTILGLNKASPAFKEIAKDTEAASKTLDSFGKDGSKSLGGVADAAAKAKAAAEDMAVRMSSAVEKATDKLEKARQSEADQLGRLRIAKENLIALEEKGTGTRLQTARAEEAVAAAMRRVEAAQKAVVSGQDKLNSARDQAIAQARKEADEAGAANVKPKLDIDIKGGLDKIKSAAVAEMKSTGIIAGAALGGGIAAGLSTVAAAGLFIGIAAAAQSSNKQVQDAYSEMWAHISNEARMSSGVLADEFIAGANRLGQTFNALKPQLSEGFAAAQPVVNDLFDGIDRGARQVMPGFVTAAKAASLASDNLADMLESTGRGVSNFLIEASEGAESGGEAITALGRIIERLGSFAGRIFADLANSSGSVFPAVERVVGTAADTIENLSDTVLPGLAASASLALGGMGLLLQLANQIVTVLGPAAPAVMTFATALKAVDLVSFGQVGASWDRLKSSVGDADGVWGKAKAGAAGFVSSGLGPLAVVAGIAAFGLDKLAESQQKTAKRQQAFTAAFRESKGAIDENVRATVAQSLANEGLLQKGKDIGVSAGVMTDAWLGNKAAMDEVRAAAARYTKELEGQGQMEGQVAQGADALSSKAHDVVTAMGDQSSETAEAARQGKLYGEAMQKGAEGAQGLAKANKEAAEALKTLHDQMAEMVNKDLAYRNSVDSTREAQGALTEAQKLASEALKAHGKKSNEYAAATRDVEGASRSLEGAYLSQAQAAYDLAVANSVATDDLSKTKEGSLAYTQEVLRMAQAAGVNAPRALQQMTANLLESDLMAIGAKRHVDELGRTVITMPDGKKIVLTAEDNASGTIQRLVNGRYVATIRLQADMSGYYRTVGQGSVLSGSSARGNATGGWINGPGTETSDSIPRMLSNNEFVVRAREAKKHGPLLEAINAGQSFPAAAGGGGMGGGGGSATAVSVGISVDPTDELARALGRALRAEIQNTAGGDVIRYFGGR